MSTKKYAIISAFGHQYRVSEGETIQTEFVDQEVGSEVKIPTVLMVSNGGETIVGQPTVPSASVSATLESQGRSKKVLVFKYLRKNHAKKLYGHKQPYSVLRINRIEG